VWLLKTGAELAKFNPDRLASAVAVSGDGRRVAAASPHGGAKRRFGTSFIPGLHEVATVWEVASGKVLARVPHEGGELALSPDGRLVAVSNQGKGDVWVYEVAGGAERFHFTHEGAVTGLAFAPNGRTLAAASTEAPIYLWDVAGALASAAPAWETAAGTVWDELASKDAARAFAAIRLLRANPEKAVALLKERPQRSTAPGTAALKKLFDDLGSGDFATRETATRTLARFGDEVRAAMREEVARTASPEAKKRLDELLARLDAPTPARLRLVRAVEVIEGLDSPEAKALLDEWATGPTGTTLAAEARDAIRRRAR
jgi:hypothetical protein